jgi:acyl carrier protein
MDRSEIESTVIQILANRLDMAMEEINVDSNLALDLSMTSFDAVEVVFEVEDTFDVEISDEKLADVRFVRDMIDLVMTEKE